MDLFTMSREDIEKSIGELACGVRLAWAPPRGEP
jgi:hypothetical protein